MKLGYARVSTVDQSLNLQLDALNKEGCERLFYDHGVSGSEATRKGLDDLIASATPGDQIVVWKLDRLGRSLSYLCSFLEMLGQQGIGFKSLTDGIDTTTASGKLMFHIIGALKVFTLRVQMCKSSENMLSIRVMNHGNCLMGSRLFLYR